MLHAFPRTGVLSQGVLGERGISLWLKMEATWAIPLTVR